MQTSRIDHSGGRVSPFKHTTPLPKINPTSPSESRGASPELEPTDTKWNPTNTPRRSRFDQQPTGGKWDSDHRARISESQDRRVGVSESDREDRSHGPSDPLATARPSGHPSGRQEVNDRPRRADGDRHNENFPPADDRAEEFQQYRDKPQETPRRETQQTYTEKVPYDSERGPPPPHSRPQRVDWSSDNGPKDRHSDYGPKERPSDYGPKERPSDYGPADRSSDYRSDNYNRHESDPEQDVPTDLTRSSNAPPSPIGQSRSTKSRGNFGPQSTSYTTNTNDDSGIAELSPDDPYRTGNRDNYNEENERYVIVNKISVIP